MKKPRAQMDAEILAELEAAQSRVDSGEPIGSVEGELGLEGQGSMEPPAPQPQPRVEESRPQPQPDNAELMREIERLKRTVSHYEQELNPAQRRAQELEREVEALRSQINAAPPAPEAPLDYGLDEDEAEFTTVKSIAEKVSKTMLQKQAQETAAVIADLKKKVAKYEAASAEMDASTAISKHRTELTKYLGGENPDDYFNHPRMEAWANNQSEEEFLALQNPVVYSTKFVAGLLNRFKSEVLKGQAKREPSHGESAVPSRIAPDVIERRDGRFGEDLVFNKETFQADVQKLIATGDTKRAERLIALAERETSA